MKKENTKNNGFYNAENVEKFRAALNAEREKIKNGAPVRVSISKGNKKMGDVLSVSLLPFISCPATCAKTCGAACYAAKIALLYPSTLAAYARNTAALIERPAAFWATVENAIISTRFFRFNVSGDILNADFFKKAVEIAERQKHCKILLFTKKYSIVNAFIDAGGEIPENMRVIFSEWLNDLSADNPYNLPRSNVYARGSERPDGWNACGGDCFECFKNGVGCWGLQPGGVIGFEMH